MEETMSEWSDQSASDRPTDRGGGSIESDPQLVFLEELVEEHATIDGDVLEIDAHTWAIHGSIAVDGDVIMAEYDTEEHARIALDELSTAQERAARR
jgi:hypothetical protein